MAKIVNARAYANNEVAFIAWGIDQPKIPGCLGFHIVREQLDASGMVIAERSLASYVAFDGQNNPDWQPQNTAVWPIQKFNWRDLTLRRKRDASGQRAESETVRYRIQAVGQLKPGMTAVTPAADDDLTHWDPVQHQRVANTYVGAPLKLGYLTGPSTTNEVTAQRRRGPFVSTFTNGILSTQFLVRAMEERGMTSSAGLATALQTPGDPLRRFLAGDVLTTVTEFFDRPTGRFHAALYELNDPELLGLLTANAARLHLVLSDAGGDKKTKVFDTTNAHSRPLLHAQNGIEIHDRMFNGTGHIGHNKFVVWSDDAGAPQSVLTGSTNWTWTGVCGQSNNCIRIDDPGVAQAFLTYWQALRDDTAANIPVPDPLSAPNTGANQGNALKTANREPSDCALAGGGTARVWFSPNMPGKQQPPSGAGVDAGAPPDVGDLFSAMRKAAKMILFAVFLPSQGGKHSIIEQAVQLGLHDPSLSVIGAISDSMAMWGYQTSYKDPAGAEHKAVSPYVFDQAGVSLARAAALTDASIGDAVIGDFVKHELLTLGKAIIHDKIVVIDPLDPVNCVVAFGSHNLGYKASYSNDENLVLVRGRPDLAQAYAVHVLDVYDHYRFRARAAAAKGKGGQWKGFLERSDAWQAKAGHRLSNYFA